MKILKPRDSEDPRTIAKKNALQQCKTCPICKSTDIYVHEYQYKYREHHFLWNETSVSDVYTCNSCGCMYESDKYEYTSEPQEYTALISIINIFVGIILFIIGMNEDIVTNTIVGAVLIIFFTIVQILCLTVYRHHDHYKFEPYDIYG